MANRITSMAKWITILINAFLLCATILVSINAYENGRAWEWVVAFMVGIAYSTASYPTLYYARRHSR